jgi:putative ATPase
LDQIGLWGQEPPARKAQSDKTNLLDVPKDAPLALRMTPRSFDEYVGQQDVVGPGKALRKAIEQDRVPSMLFWGPPGIGKTALARLVARTTHSQFRQLSAVTSGVQDVRSVTAKARQLRERGRKTILFLDEIHRFNKAQQDALLPHVENGTIVLIGATTENPYFAVNRALLSRMRLFSFGHLSPEDIATIVRRAIEDKERGLASLDPGVSIVVQDEAIEHIIGFSKGDARAALNVLEALYNVGEGRDGRVHLTLEKALEITQSPQLFYDKTGDQHYDIISAYIKSMRGSDPDAAVYWLARMLESGEDPRFVARRLCICAAEDVGNADPMALVLAEAAFRASEHLGMPEARIPLAQATIYVATAPKSNSAVVAIDKAMEDVRQKPAYPVPIHLRGTGYSGAESLGHGVDYVYPHNHPGHYVRQQYLPKELETQEYYCPSPWEKPNRNRSQDK